MHKILPLILAFSFTTKALADCKPVTPIQAGEVAPCPGFIFSYEKELQLRQMNEEYKLSQEQIKIYLQQKDLLEKQVDISNKIIEKEEQKSELWKARAVDSTEKLIAYQERQETRDWLLIISGVALTVAAGWAVGQAGK